MFLFLKKTIWKFIGIQSILFAVCGYLHASVLPCNANSGLQLLSSPINSNYIIATILNICDQNAPNDPQVLLLHGLYERKITKGNTEYQEAIKWLQKAALYASKDNLAPLFELALTYEWAGRLEDSKATYAKILLFNDNYVPAFLGIARVNKAENNPISASAYYQKVLSIDPNNIDALIGLGIINLDSNQLDIAKNYFNKVLSIKPFNIDAKRGLQEIDLILGQHIELIKVCEANFAIRILALPKPPMNVINQIVKVCDEKEPNNATVLMLHGLIERKIATKTNNYENAIGWFNRALQSGTANLIDPQLELAVTYEWAGKINQANDIYKRLLNANPKLRPALLGYARVAVLRKQYDEANKIYLDLLTSNPQDTGALNGLAWLELARKKYQLALTLFYKILAIDSRNPDALTGIQFVKKGEHSVSGGSGNKLSLCHANEGLRLLNLTKPPYTKIQNILKKCDRYSPSDVQALLLHGLLARKLASSTNGNYSLAIIWLEKASALADKNNLSPLLELGVTYEWAQEPEKAAIIYQEILNKHPTNRASLLGMARVYRSNFNFDKAKVIYSELLSTNPKDVDALNGLAMIDLANYHVAQANNTFNEALSIQKNNPDALNGLELAKSVTPYLITVDGGKYSVQGETSTTTNINVYGYLNATDQLLLFLTHNSSEIQLSSVLDPTLLPKNAVYLGFQKQFPNRYGWGIYSEYRQRTQLRNEYRLGFNLNYYIFNRLQWFGGARQGLPSPWNNKLFFTGLNILTPIPVDVSLSGYWGRQQFGGSTSSYGLDLRKEFSNRFYYDVGTSYSPSQLSWEVHGNVIVPVSRFQALEGSYQRLYLNGAVIYVLGWRINL